MQNVAPSDTNHNGVHAAPRAEPKRPCGCTLPPNAPALDVASDAEMWGKGCRLPGHRRRVRAAFRQLRQQRREREARRDGH